MTMGFATGRDELMILSVNLGTRKAIEIGNRVVETGIFKEPFAGRVEVHEYGLVGDVVVDMERHGGADQALYLYSQEDYAWWASTLDQALPVGTFGENITVSSFGPSPLKIGDRLHLNDVIVEVTFARIPCASLGARMGDPGFVKRFAEARRPGVYVRVLKTGTIQAGDPVRLFPTSEDHPTIIDLYILWHSKARDPLLLRKGLAAPLAARARAAFTYWLESG